MKKFVLLALMFGTINLASVALADSKSPVACALLNEKEAVALVGGPLGEVFKNEQKPTMENGRDHNSVCGFFPKGYKIATADLPPEQGILLTIHAMQTAAAAKNFYEQSLTSEQEMMSMPGSPLAGGKITTLSGTGKAAYLVENKIEPGSSSSGVATIVFLKGNVMGQVQVWKKGGQSVEITKKAVKNLLAKLP
jgi:hypothetical protein